MFAHTRFWIMNDDKTGLALRLAWRLQEAAQDMLCLNVPPGTERCYPVGRPGTWNRIAEPRTLSGSRMILLINIEPGLTADNPVNLCEYEVATIHECNARSIPVTAVMLPTLLEGLPVKPCGTISQLLAETKIRQVIWTNPTPALAADAEPYLAVEPFAAIDSNMREAALRRIANGILMNAGQIFSAMPNSIRRIGGTHNQMIISTE